MKSYLYTRISTLQQVEGFGIKRQINTVTDFLNYAVLPVELGYQLDIEDYELLESDLGKSAYHGRNFSKTAALGRFYESVMKGEITRGALIVENIDRLTRMSNYSASAKLTDMILRGIDIIEVETSTVFSAKIPNSQVTLSMSINRATSESKRKSIMASKSHKNKKAMALEQGIALGNNHPRWLHVVDNKYVTDKRMATVINRIFDMYADGCGAAYIIKKLNDEGDLNVNKMWDSGTFYRVLKNRRLLGELGDVKIYPQIVDNELFERVQNILNSTSQASRQKVTKRMKSLFNGIAKCIYCGGTMIADHNGQGKLFFQCLNKRIKRKCSSKSIQYSYIEKAVLEHIKVVDWRVIYSTKSSMEKTNVIRNRLIAVSAEINDIEEEMKQADDDMILALVRVLKKKRSIRDELTKEISGHNNVALQEANVDFDVSEVMKQDNIKLRQDVNLELRKIVKNVEVARYPLFTLINISYYTDVFSHMIMMSSKTGEVYSSSSLSNDLVLNSEFMDLNLLTGEVTYHKTTISQHESMVLELWQEIIEKGVNMAKEMINSKNALA
nr:recombinase family protein [uncultured Rahnella sp.]